MGPTPRKTHRLPVPERRLAGSGEVMVALLAYARWVVLAALSGLLHGLFKPPGWALARTTKLGQGGAPARPGSPRRIEVVLDATALDGGRLFRRPDGGRRNTMETGAAKCPASCA